MHHHCYVLLAGSLKLYDDSSRYFTTIQKINRQFERLPDHNLLYTNLIILSWWHGQSSSQSGPYLSNAHAVKKHCMT